jgi:hypothetical protein
LAGEQRRLQHRFQPPDPADYGGNIDSDAYKAALAIDQPKYYADWIADGAPTEPTREAYERSLILNSDNNSCGFFTIWYAMKSLGILNPPDARPYQLMANAAEQHSGDQDFTKSSNGVNLTRSGFAWQDFLYEVGHGISNTNAHAAGKPSVDQITDMVRTPDTVVLVIVMIDQKDQTNSIFADGQTKWDDHLLTTKQKGISHWVIVTGVSSDNKWFRILNPLNNQIEYYNRDDFQTSRDNSNKNAITLTRNVAG